jgi:hypothetical protein
MPLAGTGTIPQILAAVAVFHCDSKEEKHIFILVNGSEVVNVIERIYRFNWTKSPEINKAKEEFWVMWKQGIFCSCFNKLMVSCFDMP